MLKFSFLFALLTAFACGDPVPQCGQTFRFATYYGSTMVLQRAPARARVWGYAFNLGEEISLDLTNDATGEVVTYQTTAVDGTAGFPVWRFELNPMEAGGPYTITVNSSDCLLTLTDVLFGDVWLCSGQSNMVHILNDIDNPQPDIDNSVNYPNIRSFHTGNVVADTPQEDLLGVIRNWAVVAPDHIGQYSAICYLFATHLYNKYQIPIGLVGSSWGGTRIEAWSSPAALSVCFPDGVPPAEGANAASVLYNAMIHPFIPMPMSGAIWYQGESNAGNAALYGCAIREMVNDWRQSWVLETDTMDPQFPFGEVQLAPSDDNDAVTGFPDVRWHQTFEYGYVPNEQLQRFFMAVATDLPDFNSPVGAIHPRYKRQIAERLALGAFAVGYNDMSNGTHLGPLPASFSLGGDTNIIVSMIDAGQDLEQRGDPSTQDGYEVCCSADSTVICGGENTRWVDSTINAATTGSVDISLPCVEGEFATGVRYTWRESPCRVLEQCPIYAMGATGNNLPAAPFIYNGLIM